MSYFILATAVATALAQTDTASSTVAVTASPMPNFTPDAAIITAATPIISAIIGSMIGGFGLIGLVGYGLYRYEKNQREAKVIACIANVPQPA